MKPSVLVVDDHPMIVHAVEALVQEIAPSVGLLQARTMMQTLSFCRDVPGIRLVLLDLSLPDSQHTAGLSLLHDEFPNLPVVVYTGQEHVSVRSACLKAGASDFVLKSGNRSALYEVMERYLSGFAAVTPVPAKQLDELLSVRQRDVLRLLVAGSTSREIAQALNIGEATVKTHIKVIYSRTECRNRVELFQWFSRYR